MCLIAFAIGVSRCWPLVVAANRDEFLERPTLSLARWKTASGQEIISGRDLRAGGTWLGMTPGGRVAFLTNVREAEPFVAPLSRGSLVTQWLEWAGDSSSFSVLLKEKYVDYAGFNLIIGDFQKNDWAWLTNRQASLPAWHAQALQPGIYGLSNAALDTPWPKTVKVKRTLELALAAADEKTAHGAKTLQAPLWQALLDRERTLHEKLPKTGVPLAFEEALSSPFVEFPEHAYGTRASSVLLVQAQSQLGEWQQSWTACLEEKTHLRAADSQLAQTNRHVLVSWR